jgi:hypothetical protein
MRELQNFSIGLLVLIMAVVFLTTTGCSNLNAETPKPEVDPGKICWKTERFTFDEPGIGALETRMPVKCEGMIAKNE